MTQAYTPVEQLEQALEHAIQKDHPDFELVDIEADLYQKHPQLRILLGHADYSPISLDEICEQNAWISDLVEELDLFADSYTLEVSSPGVDRPLKKPRHFQYFCHERIELTTTAQEGRKKWTGILQEADEDGFSMEVDNEIVKFSYKEVKKARLKAELNFKPAQKG